MNGGWYQGEFLNDVADGKGIFHWRKKDEYGEPEIDDDWWDKGPRYEGDWENGRRHGQGTYHHEKFNYSGDWRNDKKDGEGKCEWNDEFNTSYDGEWEKDKQDGEGVEKQAGLEIYNGYFKKGKRHGYGAEKKPVEGGNPD